MKKWLDEEYEFEVEVTGYLRGEEPEGLCRNGEEVFMHIWLSSEPRGVWNMLKDHDDALSVDGGHWKWRGLKECRRFRQVCEGYRMP